MIRLSSKSTVVAAGFVLLAWPAALDAQATAASKAPATVTIEIDPWLTVWKRETAQSRVARENLRKLDGALEPYRMSYRNLTDGERAELRAAFGNVLPGQRFTTYRINEPQARAIAYLALGPARDRREHRCEYGRRPDVREPEPVPVQTGEPRRASLCDAAIDTLSRDAAWIHTAILSISRSGGGHRAKAAELDDLRSMTERARQIVVTTPRCGCRTGDDAEALLASTREAFDLVTASSVPAWMTLRSEHVQRISKLSDEVERSLLRCLSSR
jgi:hypothetical protein